MFCAAALAATTVQAAEWHIVGLNGTVPVEMGEVRFAEDGAFSGTTGCNSFQGRARFDGNQLVIGGPVATTRMACPGEAMTTQDDIIIELFRGTISVSFDPLRDVLRLSKAGTVLSLTPVAETIAGLPDLPEPHQGLGRPPGEPPYLNPFGLADEMPLHAESDSNSEVVGGAYSGQVLRNDGCRADWCRLTKLDGSITGWGQRQYLEPSDSALRAGQSVFDATGIVPCAKGIGAPMAQCVFGVARDGGGTASVVVDRTDGLRRALFFSDGAFLGADTSEADGGHEVSVTQEGDLFLIRVNDERYEIPDAVIRGG